jgi:peptidoglycan/LPS O-acetylase OafA/YrhL
MSQQKFYFPNLNGLRFIAALMVIVHHIEQFKIIYKITIIPNFWESKPYFQLFGKLGVDLFFVLSGFLITYIMLFEERQNNKIRIWDFYKRRILRIWPLYFLIVLLAFFILPQVSLFTIPNIGSNIINDHFASNLILYIFFLPNLALSLFMPIPFAAQAWSIGTEEQFYLVWPLLLTKIRKNRLFLMLSIVFIYWIISAYLNIYNQNLSNQLDVFRQYWNTFKINCMAIGAFFSIVYFKKLKILKYFLNNFVFFVALISSIILISQGTYLPYINVEAYSFLFGLIILNLAANERLKNVLEFKFLNYLGKISYGLYMFHAIAIVLTINSMQHFNIQSYWLIYPISIIITIVLSSVSYKYLETYFLKIKK